MLMHIISRIFRTVFVAAALIGLFFLWLLSQVFFRPLYHGPCSDHFDGKRFFNNGQVRRSFWVFMKWMLARSSASWPKRNTNNYSAHPPKRVSNGQLEATFVNHSTVLIQWDGINILTDPIWSERCSPFSWLGPKRVHPPGIAFENLPPIDLVLLSHNHYDHMDIPTLKKLATRDNPTIVTGLGNRLLLKKHGMNKIYELDWWQEVALDSNITVAFVPARHFSGRHLGDRDLTLWGGFVLQRPSGVVYFAGDTGYGNHYQEIRDRFGPPSLAILPIGAYTPRWFMHPAHQSPIEAVQAHQELGAQKSFAIHFGTFNLADEEIYDPPTALTRELCKQGILQETFIIPEPGKCFEI